MRLDVRLLLLVLGLTWATSGCMMGPSPQYAQCHQACRTQHQRCTIDATTAQQLEGCDLEYQRCESSCPP